MSALLEHRSPVGQRVREALAVAMTELNVAELSDVMGLASGLAGLPVYPDTAIAYFEDNSDLYTVTQVGEKFLIRKLPV